jgi:hypothetical protein
MTVQIGPWDRCEQMHDALLRKNLKLIDIEKAVLDGDKLEAIRLIGEARRIEPAYWAQVVTRSEEVA